MSSLNQRQIDNAIADHMNATTTKFVNKLGAILVDIGDVLCWSGVGALAAGHIHHIGDYLIYRQYNGFEASIFRDYKYGEWVAMPPSYDKAHVDDIIKAVINRHRFIMKIFIGSAVSFGVGYLMRRLGRHLRARKVSIW